MFDISQAVMMGNWIEASEPKEFIMNAPNISMRFIFDNAADTRSFLNGDEIQVNREEFHGGLWQFEARCKLRSIPGSIVFADVPE